MSYFAIGTYRGAVHLFKISTRENSSNQQLELTPLFSDDSQTRSIKCMAICAKFFASSSSDESVKICDILRKREIGNLIKLQDVIDMTFYRTQILITLSIDGLLRLWSTANFELFSEFNAHVNGGLGLAIIRNLPICLSIGANDKIKLWDFNKNKLATCGSVIEDSSIKTLNNSKNASVKNFIDEPTKIIASNISDQYALIFANKIILQNYRTQECKKILGTKNVLSFGFLSGNRVVYSGESKDISIFSIDKEDVILKWSIPYNRTRDLKVVNIPEFGEILITIHSEGNVIIWDMRNFNDSEPVILCNFPINDRPVCLSVNT